MAINPGNSPRIIAMFINGLRILKRRRDIQYATEIVKNTEIIQEKIAIIKVFINIFGKFSTPVSVKRRM
jgi:hypothetical protein